MKTKLSLLAIIFALAACTTSDRNQDYNWLNNDHWEIGYNYIGIQSLISPDGPLQANILSDMPDAEVRFQINDGEWQEVFKRNGGFYRSPEEEYTFSRQHNVDGNQIQYTDYQSGMPFALEQTYTLDGETLEWDIVVQNKTQYEARIGDVSIDFSMSGAASQTQEGLFEGGYELHRYISGDSSFLLGIRRSGAPPYLLLTVKPGTHLEYSEGSEYFIHSGYSGNQITQGTWRQPHTYNRLMPQGDERDRLEYGFELQWADTYDELRQILYDNGLIDVRVVPGMTVPNGLEARFSLHTKTNIDSVVAEFPAETKINYIGENQPDHHVYSVNFNKLGENKLTVHFDGNRTTYLEFFSTEPVETLLEKRSDFIVENQQHRDPDLWYDGLFSIWDMKNTVLRGPDNTDGWEGWYTYMVATDDPVLGIPAYLASVNALNPDPEQIEALEYHLENYVWGGLQRTSDQEPYPYGIYGVPNFRVASDTMLRAKIENRRLDKMKIWRAYDYPHVFMLYYHMYQIANRYPDMVSYLDAEGYLERMVQTARAFFQYPYEIYPWYDIYKWGFYNELLIPEIIDLLEEKDRQDDADFLRHHWEIKTRWFVVDDPYPYRSEYPTDRTAFESTYALARYAAKNELPVAEDLWYDKNMEVMRSYDRTTTGEAMDFMEDQHYAGLAERGWLETKYYQYGADGSMSYMARMHGWSILNYGLEFASDPHDWLQLGYASYLSSFALMNTGTPESNYGFWYPGEANDGALGWAFQREKFGGVWNQKQEPRGSWRYDGEGNLGMGAVTRMASTILTEDPLFGWLAYGGTLENNENGFEILPKDGVRIRFWLVEPDYRLGVELSRDRWSDTQPIEVNAERTRMQFPVTNTYGDEHITELTLSTNNGQWDVSLDGESLEGTDIGNGQYEYELPISQSQHILEIVKQ
jgi:hypothetical protein